jgi:hypothetical protein
VYVQINQEAAKNAHAATYHYMKGKGITHGMRRTILELL